MSSETVLRERSLKTTRAEGFKPTESPYLRLATPPPWLATELAYGPWGFRLAWRDDERIFVDRLVPRLSLFVALLGVLVTFAFGQDFEEQRFLAEMMIAPAALAYLSMALLIPRSPNRSFSMTREVLLLEVEDSERAIPRHEISAIELIEDRGRPTLGLLLCNDELLVLDDRALSREEWRWLSETLKSWLELDGAREDAEFQAD